LEVRVLTTSSEGELRELIRIEDPEFYSGDPYPALARLRAEAPVFHYEPLNVWVLSRYEDIRLVGRSQEIFSNSKGNNLNDVRYGDVSTMFFGQENIGAIDPPRHRELRRIVAPSLSPKRMAAMEDAIRANAVELVGKIVPDQPIDFVAEIAAILPLQAICAVIGIPTDYVAELKYWSDETLKLGAALDAAGLAEAYANTLPMTTFLNEWIVRKLGDDSDDMIGTLIKATVSGENIPYDTLHMFLKAVLVAGNETTRDLIAGSVFTFAEYPDQIALLAADQSLIGNAVEECLRWVTPVRGFVRYVMQDVEIRGQAIKAGEFVQLLWTAANRDEEIWQHADRFDVMRVPDPKHQAFGFGEHICAGAALARLEARVFFEELIARYPRWELAGAPVRPNSVLHNSFEELPVIFYEA
jgi:cytochrome P450